MANRLQWQPQFSVIDQAMDAQHRAAIDTCNTLADCLDTSDEPRFDAVFKQLMALAREHFAAEEALLLSRGYPEIEDYRAEREEFAYLADEIITTANFDRQELQSFLALWWSGHIVGAARKQRAFFEK
ncbi:MAG: hemerythrin family protein [Betaproteobacteria bacterium]|nr:hemerythrin family protein [Betaproteobacteria bacterium]